MKIFSTNLFDLVDGSSLPRPKSVLQVGASGGQEVHFFREHGVQAGLFIEPLDYPFEVLSQNCKNIKGFFPLKAIALSLDDKTVVFHVASNAGMSSSILPPKSHIESYPHVKFEDTLELQGYTLDTLVSRSAKNFLGCPFCFDLIYIDVQGAELEVFKGASFQLQSARYVFTEVGLGGGYQNDVELETLIGFLRAFGFRLLALEVGARTGYGNAFFARL
jgi:FkbM family methyltransferase